MVQIGVGIIVDTLIWFYVVVQGLRGRDRVGLLLANAVVPMLVGLVACGAPVGRALRIESTEALRDVG